MLSDIHCLGLEPHHLIIKTSYIDWWPKKYRHTHTYVKISCDTTQYTKFPFFVMHAKPHGMRGLRNHYHLCLDPKLGHGKFSMLRITCACDSYTNILNKRWDPGVSHTK